MSHYRAVRTESREEAPLLPQHVRLRVHSSQHPFNGARHSRSICSRARLISALTCGAIVTWTCFALFVFVEEGSSLLDRRRYEAELVAIGERKGRGHKDDPTPGVEENEIHKYITRFSGGVTASRWEVKKMPQEPLIALKSSKSGRDIDRAQGERLTDVHVEQVKSELPGSRNRSAMLRHLVRSGPEATIKFAERSEVVLMLTPPSPDSPGEQGRGVVVNKETLSSEERAEYDLGWKLNSFNQFVSDRISLLRTIPDNRLPQCKELVYEIDKFPDTTVIIVFHNEGRSTLLRTIYSVITRSPASLLAEIVLVDDFSDQAYLKEGLELDISGLKKVRLIRNEQREGLVRSRLRGTAVARGAVLTFLDSHCEVTTGWLEPLMARIAVNTSIVAMPVIDSVRDDTFQYDFVLHEAVGAFDWNLFFKWVLLPPHLQQGRTSVVDPMRTPAMAGGLFSISKAFFEHIGTYDAGQKIWGGENVEISLRIWMCGGSLEILPCSHVGHVFRAKTPYTWDSKESTTSIVTKNMIRIAEVWLDEYKLYFHQHINYRKYDYGDVSERQELRRRLQCQSFQWYIDNIYPEMFNPKESLAQGRLQNQLDASLCLTFDGGLRDDGFSRNIGLEPCQRDYNSAQHWFFTKDNQIRTHTGCLDTLNTDLIQYPCHGQKGKQEWIFDQPTNAIQHSVNYKIFCLEYVPSARVVRLSQCLNGSMPHSWVWTDVPAPVIER